MMYKSIKKIVIFILTILPIYLNAYERIEIWQDINQIKPNKHSSIYSLEKKPFTIRVTFKNGFNLNLLATKHVHIHRNFLIDSLYEKQLNIKEHLDFEIFNPNLNLTISDNILSNWYFDNNDHSCDIIEYIHTKEEIICSRTINNIIQKNTSTDTTVEKYDSRYIFMTFFEKPPNDRHTNVDFVQSSTIQLYFK